MVQEKIRVANVNYELLLLLLLNNINYSKGLCKAK